MHQVWEQRRLQRAQDHGDGNFEIVLENQMLEEAERSNAKPCPRPPNAQPAKGAARSVRQTSTRKLPRSNTSDGAVKRTKGEASKDDSKYRQLGGNDGEAVRKPGKVLSGAVHGQQSTIIYDGNFPTSRKSSAATTPNAIGMRLVDPFDSCAISLGPKESRYLTHYFQAFSCRFTLPKRTWLRYAIHDAGLLHGVLAIAAAHYSFATTQGFSDDALYHHGKTINHVQKCLGDPVLRFSDGVIGAIGRMAICHLIFGNRQHFITHTKALQRCAEARGGLESLGMVGQLKFVISSCVAGAATIWWDDVPPQLKYPYGFLDYPAVDDVRDAESRDPELGSAFRELYEIGFLSSSMLDICEAVVALNSVISSQREWNESQQRIFGDQCNKLSLRLVYLKESEAFCHREMTECDHMRECVRLAVHLYVTVFQRDVPVLSNLAVQTLQRLSDYLSVTGLENPWGGGQLGEVLLWVLTITASGCVMPKQREWAGPRLRKIATQLGLTEWSQVKRICRRFLFLESAVEWKTSPLWKDYGP